MLSSCSKTSPVTQILNKASDYDSKQRRSVERCFDKAAISYDANAEVQKEAVSLLHKQITSARPQGVDNTNTVQAEISLDIGCGTGAIYRQLRSDVKRSRASFEEEWVNLDLSHAMLKECMNLHDPANTVLHSTQGDAYSLPIQTGVIQNVYSSMALQWCNTPALALAEIARVLSVGGNAHLAIMIAPSFSYISEAWERAGYVSRINTFLSADNWTSSLPHSLELVSSSEQCISSEHENLRELLLSIKSVGANASISNLGNADNASHAKQLTRTELEAVEQQCRARGEGFMLDYHLLFLHLRKV